MENTMRITNSLLFNTSLRNYQTSSEKLYKLNEQISSKLKIQNSYEDTSVYIDAMRLNNEIETLQQSIDSSSKAKTFANNTDTTLTSFNEQLDQFKTKLIQASSSSNSSTSLEALANDLQGIKDSMVILANTSINGQFLFSGSALSQKPISSDGTYNGNSDSLTAVIGSGVELPYNVTGQSLFLGKDTDYNRIVSTNVSMYNQSKLNPSVMMTDQNVTSSQVYLKDTDTIRDLVGDTNSVATDDPKAVFYLSGKKSDGAAFSNVIEIDTSSKVSDLLESIGNAYGNTATNKVVDVTMNARGQIEVKDLKSGSQLLDMNIFGAIDRNALPGETGNAKQVMNVDNLLTKPNVDIIAFSKSNYETTASTPDLTMRSSAVTSGTFAIDFPMKNVTNSNMTSTTLLSGILPLDVDHIDFGGTSFSTAGKTVQDLMSAIETEYGLGAGDVTLSGGGRMLINDPTNTFSASLVPKNAANALAHGDPIPDAMNSTRRGYEKDGNTLSSNVSQVVKKTSDFATASTKLVDVAGVDSLNGKQMVITYTDKSGVNRTGTLNLDIADTTFSVDLDGDGNTTDPNETFSIYNGGGDPSNLKTTADKMTYQQLNDLISMVTSGNLPKQGVSTAAQTAINNAIVAGIPPINAATLATETATAKTGVSAETASYIQKAIDAGIIRDNPASTPAAIAKATIDYNDAIGNANLAEYNQALSSAKNSVEVTLDYQGKMSIKDKTASESKINFTMYDKSATDFTGVGSSALSFMENNAVTISNPSIDMFKQLDEMIAAVRSGNFRMDSTSSDPRNIGIQNSLTQLDHIADHVTKAQTQIGSLSNALSDANTRSTMLNVNVQSIQTTVIGVDTAAAYLEFQSVTTAYEAMLSTISKVNSMSLLNYM